MGNTISNAAATNGPVKAGTAPITYSGPGTPLIPEFSGQAVIQNGYEQSVWVARGLQTIAETIAALPFVAGMDPDNPAITNPQAPLARLLGPATPRAPGGPNPQWSSQQYWNWQTLQKLATGKMAAELQVDKIAKGPDGKSPAIVGLWPLVSYLLNPISSAGGGTTYFDGFQYQLPTGVRDLKPEQVFYAWKKSLTDPRQPESLLRSAGLPISISVAIERYTWALLQNGMVATHVVTSAPLEEPDMRRAWEEQFVSNFTGFDQAGKPIFAYADVENGKVTDAFNIQSIAQTSQQAELLAMAGWVKNEILVALGVPESLIGNACLKADEMVRLADGSRRKAADLVGSTFEVLTSTPDGPQVRDAYASWNDVEPCFAVTTESGRRLMCNARHPLFAATYTRTKDVVRGPLGRTKPGATMAAPRHCPGVDVKGWTRLQDLAVDDLLAVTTEFPTVKGEPYDLDAAKVLGYLIGDGCCGGGAERVGGGGQAISFAAERSVHSDDFAASVNALGDTVRRYKTKVGSVPVWGVAGGTVRKLLVVEGLLGSRGHNKHIPEGIWSAGEVAQREFLSRLYATDGCASLGYVGREKDNRGHASYGTATIDYSTISQQLALDVQELLLRFGIPARVSVGTPKPSKLVPGQRQPYYRVDISVAEDVVRFADVIGIFGKEEAVAACRAHAAAQIGRKRTPKWRTRHLNLGLRWEKIKSIEPVGVDATVAVTVPDGNTYLSTFWEHNSQRIYANADSEERTFWSGRVINTVAELQDDINTFLAPKLGPEVGWFDLSRVSALQPPTPFMQPQLTDLINAGIMTVAEAQQQLGVADSGFIDTSDVLLGEESSTGTSIAGKASAPIPELRGWTWEHRGMNLNTYRSGTWRRLVHTREHIDIRSVPAPVIDVASTPMLLSIEHNDTRGYDKALEVLATVTSLREKRTPDTAAASTVHHKIGKTGQPLWKHKGQQLPAYIQNLAKHFVGSMGESAGIAQAVGIVRDWSEGHDGHGHKVHPDVQAAAARAIAEFDADKHTRDDDAWADLDRLAKEHDLEPRAVAEFGPGGAGSTFSGNNPDASGAGLMLPIAEGLKPKPREAELAGPHRYTPNVRDAKHCAKCGKGPLAKVHKDWAAVKRDAGELEHRVGPKGYVHGWIFVGAPGVGDEVQHPHHGHGRVSAVHEGSADVKWDKGGETSTHDVMPGQGPSRFVGRDNVDDPGANPQTGLTAAVRFSGPNGDVLINPDGSGKTYNKQGKLVSTAPAGKWDDATVSYLNNGGKAGEWSKVDTTPKAKAPAPSSKPEEPLDLSGMSKDERIAAFAQHVQANHSPVGSRELSRGHAKYAAPVETSLREYTGAAYSNINRRLRGEGSLTPAAKAVADEHIRNIDKAAEQPLGHDVSVTRELKMNGAPKESDYKPGSIISDKGFASTELAGVRNKAWTPERTSVTMHITVPKEAHGVWMAPRSDFAGEHEVLLARDTPLLITKVERKKDGPGLHVHAIALPKKLSKGTLRHDRVEEVGVAGPDERRTVREGRRGQPGDPGETPGGGSGGRTSHRHLEALRPQRSSVAAVEALLGRPVESRHRGPDHVHVPTGHANTPVRKRQAMKAAHKQALAGYEAAFTGPMRDLFAKQEKSALVRLTGRRGKVMVRRATEAILEARATSQPGPVDPTTAPTSEPAPPQPASVDPAALLPVDYWIAQTAKALEGPYNHVADASTAQVRGQLGGAVSEEANSLSAAQVKAALRARAATVSSSITNTTYQAIAKTLGEGITSGESISQLAERVKTVFADANHNRAALIARTEAGSASNTAQMTYAQSLPQGIVAGKEWLAVHDTRTRHDHHLADGQRQPLGVPFRVGGYAMDRPGDPAAPPDLTINCRCTTAFIPQSQSHLLLQQPPKDFTYNPQAPTAA